MDTECVKCGYKPEDHCAAERLTMAECEECGLTCEKCLKEMAVGLNMVTEEDASLVVETDGAAGFLRECDTTGQTLCSQCFVEPEEEDRHFVHGCFIVEGHARDFLTDGYDGWVKNSKDRLKYSMEQHITFIIKLVYSATFSNLFDRLDHNTAYDVFKPEGIEKLMSHAGIEPDGQHEAEEQ